MSKEKNQRSSLEGFKMSSTAISNYLKKGIEPLTTIITEQQYKAVLPNLVIITT